MTTFIANTLSYDDVWLAGCRLVVKNGKVWKAQFTGYCYGILPREDGKFSWQPFNEDTVRWVHGGELDWQDHTWLFSEGTFELSVWNKKDDVKRLLNYIAEYCGEYASADGWTMKAKPGYQFRLEKLPHNCGNKFTIVTV